MSKALRTAAVLFTLLMVLALLSGCLFNATPPSKTPPAFVSSEVRHVAAYGETLNGNEIWCASLQLCWNNAVALNGGPLGGSTEAARALDEQLFTAADLEADSYYAYSDIVSDPAQSKRDIEEGVQAKFSQSSDLVDHIAASPGDLLFYAMLYRKFSYASAFAVLEDAPFTRPDGSQTAPVKYFGFEEDTEGRDAMARQVEVLYYNDESDHAVSISTTEGDTVILVRSPENGSTADIYAAMQAKAGQYGGETFIGGADTLKIPNVEIDVFDDFSEDLSDASVFYNGAHHRLSQALQQTRLSMDNTGGEVKSEASMSFSWGVDKSKKAASPRHFDYSGDYAVMLLDGSLTASSKPYFAARVCDAALFQGQ